MFIGPVGVEAHKKLSYDQPSDKENFDVLLQKLDLYFIFGSRTRNHTESIDNYVDNLMHIAISSKHAQVQNIVKEKIILDMVKEKFQDETQVSLNPTSKKLAMDLRALTLNDVILSWKFNELSLLQNKGCTSKSAEVGSEMNNCVRCGTNHPWNKCPAHGTQCSSCKMFNHFTEKCTTLYVKDCSKCGSSHIQSRCIAFGHVCSKCGKRNHFASKCKIPMVENCVRCGTNHAVSSCPAQGCIIFVLRKLALDIVKVIQAIQFYYIHICILKRQIRTMSMNVIQSHARAPDPLSNIGDMAGNWRRWKNDFMIFMKLTDYINKSSDIKANFLKNRLGQVGLAAIEELSFNKPEDVDNMEILLQKLDTYFDPPKNEVVERYNFFIRKKQNNERIEDYINSLREKSKTCNFGELTESLIRDKIILELKDDIFRKKVFEVENLDLAKLISMHTEHNIDTEQMKRITKENTGDKSNNQPPPPTFNRVCWRCKTNHPIKHCPAWGQRCEKCGELHHYSYCCRNAVGQISNKDKCQAYADKNTMHNAQKSKANVDPANNESIKSNENQKSEECVLL
ncbi:hypothetical protein KM043_006810 [Ampulex compressa]|nr:hypothetical protein KM043_006810 [Ampulex compressa]